jgi:hypothetical protein
MSGSVNILGGVVGSLLLAASPDKIGSVEEFVGGNGASQQQAG